MSIRIPKPRTAFSLIELLVVVAIIAVLAMISVTVIGTSMRKARAIKCANFMRELGKAAMLYAGDNDMTLPVTVHQRQMRVKSWTITLQNYANGKVTYRCPDDPDKKRAYTYVINDFLTPNPAGAAELNFSRLANLQRPASTILFAEASPAYANADHFHFADYWGRPIPRGAFEGQVAVKAHGDGANYVFADGHMESLSWEKVQERLGTVGDKFVDPTAGEE